MTDTLILQPRRNPLLYIVLAGALVLAFLVFKGCQHSKTQLVVNSELKQQADILIAQHNTDSVVHEQDIAFWQKQAALSAQQRFNAEVSKDSVAHLLDNTQARARKLIAERDSYKDALPDSSWVLVDPRYTDDCDNCFETLKVQTEQITGYRQESENLADILARETRIRDSTITKEREYSGKLKLEARGFQTLFENSQKINKPRNKVYLVGTIHTDIMRLGYGGGMALTTKKGMLYSVKVGSMNKKPFYQVDAGLLLSLRK